MSWESLNRFRNSSDRSNSFNYDGNSYFNSSNYSTNPYYGRHCSSNYISRWISYQQEGKYPSSQSYQGRNFHQSGKIPSLIDISPNIFQATPDFNKNVTGFANINKINKIPNDKPSIWKRGCEPESLKAPVKTSDGIKKTSRKAEKLKTITYVNTNKIGGGTGIWTVKPCSKSKKFKSSNAKEVKTKKINTTEAKTNNTDVTPLKSKKCDTEKETHDRVTAEKKCDGTDTSFNRVVAIRAVETKNIDSTVVKTNKTDVISLKSKECDVKKETHDGVTAKKKCDGTDTSFNSVVAKKCTIRKVEAKNVDSTLVKTNKTDVISLKSKECVVKKETHDSVMDKKKCDGTDTECNSVVNNKCTIKAVGTIKIDSTEVKTNKPVVTSLKSKESDMKKFEIKNETLDSVVNEKKRDGTDTGNNSVVNNKCTVKVVESTKIDSSEVKINKPDATSLKSEEFDVKKEIHDGIIGKKKCDNTDTGCNSVVSNKCTIKAVGTIKIDSTEVKTSKPDKSKESNMKKIEMNNETLDGVTNEKKRDSTDPGNNNKCTIKVVETTKIDSTEVKINNPDTKESDVEKETHNGVTDEKKCGGPDNGINSIDTKKCTIEVVETTPTSSIKDVEIPMSDSINFKAKRNRNEEVDSQKPDFNSVDNKVVGKPKNLSFCVLSSDKKKKIVPSPDVQQVFEKIVCESLISQVETKHEHDDKILSNEVSLKKTDIDLLVKLPEKVLDGNLESIPSLRVQKENASPSITQREISKESTIDKNLLVNFIEEKTGLESTSETTDAQHDDRCYYAKDELQKISQVSIQKSSNVTVPDVKPRNKVNPKSPNPIIIGQPIEVLSGYRTNNISVVRNVFDRAKASPMVDLKQKNVQEVPRHMRPPIYNISAFPTFQNQYSMNHTSLDKRVPYYIQEPSHYQYSVLKANEFQHQYQHYSYHPNYQGLPNNHQYVSFSDFDPAVSYNIQNQCVHHKTIDRSFLQNSFPENLKSECNSLKKGVTPDKKESKDSENQKQIKRFSRANSPNTLEKSNYHPQTSESKTSSENWKSDSNSKNKEVTHDKKEPKISENQKLIDKSFPRAHSPSVLGKNNDNPQPSESKTSPRNFKSNSNSEKKELTTNDKEESKKIENQKQIDVCFTQAHSPNTLKKCNDNPQTSQSKNDEFKTSPENLKSSRNSGKEEITHGKKESAILSENQKQNDESFSRAHSPNILERFNDHSQTSVSKTQYCDIITMNESINLLKNKTSFEFSKNIMRAMNKLSLDLKGIDLENKSFEGTLQSFYKKIKSELLKLERMGENNKDNENLILMRLNNSVVSFCDEVECIKNKRKTFTKDDDLLFPLASEICTKPDLDLHETSKNEKIAGNARSLDDEILNFLATGVQKFQKKSVVLYEKILNPTISKITGFSSTNSEMFPSSDLSSEEIPKKPQGLEISKSKYYESSRKSFSEKRSDFCSSSDGRRKLYEKDEKASNVIHTGSREKNSDDSLYHPITQKYSPRNRMLEENQSNENVQNSMIIDPNEKAVSKSPPHSKNRIKERRPKWQAQRLSSSPEQYERKNDTLSRSKYKITEKRSKQKVDQPFSSSVEYQEKDYRLTKSIERPVRENPLRSSSRNIEQRSKRRDEKYTQYISPADIKKRIPIVISLSPDRSKESRPLPVFSYPQYYSEEIFENPDFNGINLLYPKIHPSVNFDLRSKIKKRDVSPDTIYDKNDLYIKAKQITIERNFEEKGTSHNHVTLTTQKPKHSQKLQDLEKYFTIKNKLQKWRSKSPTSITKDSNTCATSLKNKDTLTIDDFEHCEIPVEELEQSVKDILDFMETKLPSLLSDDDDATLSDKQSEEMMKSTQNYGVKDIISVESEEDKMTDDCDLLNELNITKNNEKIEEPLSEHPNRENLHFEGISEKQNVENSFNINMKSPLMSTQYFEVTPELKREKDKEKSNLQYKNNFKYSENNDQTDEIKLNVKTQTSYSTEMILESIDNSTSSYMNKISQHHLSSNEIHTSRTEPHMNPDDGTDDIHFIEDLLAGIDDTFFVGVQCEQSKSSNENEEMCNNESLKASGTDSVETTATAQVSDIFHVQSEQPKPSNEKIRNLKSPKTSAINSLESSQSSAHLSTKTCTIVKAPKVLSTIICEDSPIGSEIINLKNNKMQSLKHQRDIYKGDIKSDSKKIVGTKTKVHNQIKNMHNPKESKTNFGIHNKSYKPLYNSEKSAIKSNSQEELTKQSDSKLETGETVSTNNYKDDVLDSLVQNELNLMKQFALSSSVVEGENMFTNCNVNVAPKQEEHTRKRAAIEHENFLTPTQKGLQLKKPSINSVLQGTFEDNNCDETNHINNCKSISKSNEKEINPENSNNLNGKNSNGDMETLNELTILEDIELEQSSVIKSLPLKRKLSSCTLQGPCELKYAKIDHQSSDQKNIRLKEKRRTRTKCVKLELGNIWKVDVFSNTSDSESRELPKSIEPSVKITSTEVNSTSDPGKCVVATINSQVTHKSVDLGKKGDNDQRNPTEKTTSQKRINRDINHIDHNSGKPLNLVKEMLCLEKNSRSCAVQNPNIPNEFKSPVDVGLSPDKVPPCSRKKGRSCNPNKQNKLNFTQNVEMLTGEEILPMKIKQKNETDSKCPEESKVSSDEDKILLPSKRDLRSRFHRDQNSSKYSEDSQPSSVEEKKLLKKKRRSCILSEENSSKYSEDSELPSEGDKNLPPLKRKLRSFTLKVQNNLKCSEDSELSSDEDRNSSKCSEDFELSSDKDKNLLPFKRNRASCTLKVQNSSKCSEDSELSSDEDKNILPSKRNLRSCTLNDQNNLKCYERSKDKEKPLSNRKSPNHERFLSKKNITQRIQHSRTPLKENDFKCSKSSTEMLIINRKRPSCNPEKQNLMKSSKNIKLFLDDSNRVSETRYPRRHVQRVSLADWESDLDEKSDEEENS